MKFTKDTVAALTMPPGKTDHIEWDTELPGFGVRLRGERKRWVVQYRIGPLATPGKPWRHPQGQARRRPQDRPAALCPGRARHDPAAERAHARTAALHPN